MTKFAIKKHIEFLTISFAATTVGYFCISWLNVVLHNLTPNYEYPNWNMFQNIITHSHTPTYAILICILFATIIDLLQIIHWNYAHPKRTVPTTTERGHFECMILFFHI